MEENVLNIYLVSHLCFVIDKILILLIYVIILILILRLKLSVLFNFIVFKFRHEKSLILDTHFRYLFPINL